MKAGSFITPKGLRGRSPRQAILGLDVGSTLIKAVVFDAEGEVLATAGGRVPVRRPRPSMVERDADATWKVVTALLREVSAGRNIGAVGLTGCGNGAVFVDEALRPLRAGILSSDQRAAPWVHRAPWSRQKAYPGQSGSLLRWLRAAEPATARKLAHIVPWKDFIRARLTGVVATDPTDAGAAGWLDPAIRTLRVHDPAIPPLRESLTLGGEVTPRASRLTGLAAGTPVFMGCIDCEAAALGSGTGAPGELSLVAGTWSINQMLVDRLPRRTDHFLVNPSAQPGRWLVLEGSPTSAANLDWALGVLGAGSPQRALQRAGRTPRSRALFVPRAPTGGAAWLSVGSTQDRWALLRAVVEGVVFAHRVHVEQLVGRRPAPVRVRLAGGIARSDFVGQLFADVLGCVVEVPAGNEIGALGAALCAGVGLGIWPTLSAAQSATVRVARVFRPRPDEHVELTRDFLRFQQSWHSSFP